ncbi:extracellular solute-binding protein [Nitratireductor indicus C115]|uniref:Extracellular solute-binding protein n=1 Tax=Nitratireductor indicus C115 TaxID=1231190 RepID=K2PRP0_9HYPH|nr:extracellular solute-binding protein [Nitratireductor indicus C115]SFQ79390.1 peptide/nickel transport system substrate-binding protein [Nitratireductor indicus]
MKSQKAISRAIAAAAFLVATSAFAAAQQPARGIAMHGKPALADDFGSFPYVNADAPKGGAITYCVVGTFDNLNPFILKSMRTTARGVVDTIFGNLVFEPLMMRSADEPFSLYGLLAESVSMNEERTEAEFNLNPDAKWSDGEPVTPEDVIFTYEVFAKKGRPPYSSRMDKIEKIEKTGEHSVRFTFNDKADREFPLIVALTPIVPAHAFDEETFDRSTLKPVIGSGAYRISKVEPGTRIVFERNREYWGENVPSKRGYDNFDRITIEYFLNVNSLIEAFKKGICSVYSESDPVRRQRGIDFPAAQDGRVVAETFRNGVPPAVSGFFFNTRRAKFADPRVRRALSKLYDFGWINKNILNGEYERTLSYWQGSYLSALGEPANEKEKGLLEPFMDRVTPDVMDGTYGKRETAGAELGRDELREAFDLLKEAGYKLQGRQLVNSSGEPLTMEILVTSQEGERLAAVYQRALQKLGIGVSIRLLDDSQAQQRKQSYDFDVIIASVGFSGTLSPGIEQINRWGSQAARTEGTFNLSGSADPAIDAMIEAMLNARTEDDYIAAVRALDRLLIAGAYVVPMQHNNDEWVAYWAKYAHPDKTPLYGYKLQTWWQKPESN